MDTNENCQRCKAPVDRYGICRQCADVLKLEAVARELETIPPMYMKATPPDWFLSLEDVPPIVFIHGLPGVGKSWDCRGIQRRMIETAEYRVNTNTGTPTAYGRNLPAWTPAAKALRLAGAARFEKDSPLSEMAINKGALFVDDLGATGAAGYEIGQLLAMIDHRLAWGLPTIVNSNLALPDVSTKIDDRLASRLAGGLVVEITGRDRRTDGLSARRIKI